MLDEKTIAVPGGPAQQVLRGGSGPALVWLHGITGIAPDDDLLSALARDHSVIAPIQPGRRDLAELDSLDDLHDLVLHYDSLFEALGLERFVLAGHGFGAMLAAEIAAHYPKRAAQLALIAPLGLWNDAYPVADLFALPYAQVDAFLWQGAKAQPAAKAAAEAIDPAEQNIHWINRTGSAAKFIWAIPDRGLKKRLHRIACPTLVVFGESDAYVPAAYADDFVAAIKGARKLIVKGSHMLPFEQPAEIAAALRSLSG